MWDCGILYRLVKERWIIVFYQRFKNEKIIFSSYSTRHFFPISMIDKMNFDDKIFFSVLKFQINNFFLQIWTLNILPKPRTNTYRFVWHFICIGYVRHLLPFIWCSNERARVPLQTVARITQCYETYDGFFHLCSALIIR